MPVPNFAARYIYYKSVYQMQRSQSNATYLVNSASNTVGHLINPGKNTLAYD
jgi:hypothetical protein